jgi:hypothetical protein
VQSRSWHVLFGALLCCATAFATRTRAEFSLELPAPRYDNGNGAKHCGHGTLSDDEAPLLADVSPDDNRNTDRITTGGTDANFLVRWVETVGQTGTWRIAIDADESDGASTDDFDANVLVTLDDPPGTMGNTEGGAWEAEFILPSERCERCTLQLMQIATSSPTPSLDEQFVACADIDIAPPRATDDDSPEGCQQARQPLPLLVAAVLMALSTWTKRRRGG